MTIYVNVTDLVSNPSLVALAKGCDIVAMSDDDTCLCGDVKEGKEVREWSEKAQKNYFSDTKTLHSFAMKEEIGLWLSRAMVGIAFNNDPKKFPLPNPLAIESILKYIADLYDIDPSDIVKILQMKD